jgi:hypothetical protein
MIAKPSPKDFQDLVRFAEALNAYNEYLASDQGKPRELSANCLLDLERELDVTPEVLQRWALVSGEPTAFGIACYLLHRLEFGFTVGRVMELRAIIQKHDQQ